MGRGLQEGYDAGAVACVSDLTVEENEAQRAAGRGRCWCRCVLLTPRASPCPLTQRPEGRTDPPTLPKARPRPRCHFSQLPCPAGSLQATAPFLGICPKHECQDGWGHSKENACQCSHVTTREAGGRESARPGPGRQSHQQWHFELRAWSVLHHHATTTAWRVGHSAWHLLGYATRQDSTWLMKVADLRRVEKYVKATSKQ